MTADPVIEPGAWDMLAIHQPNQVGEYAVRPSGVSYAGLDVLIAIDGAQCRHLLIPIRPEVEIIEDRASSGVQVVAHRLMDSRQQILFVDLTCRKPHLNGLFGSLVDDVLHKIRSGTDRPDQVCIRILDQWRELFERAADETLSKEALVGLFGELKQLDAITAINAAAINTWTGPEGHRHDFSQDLLGLESKTTSLRRGRTIQIHGPFQLEPVLGGQLFLVFLKVEVTMTSGTSIPEVVERILARGVRRQSLARKLSLIGYDIEDNQSYNDFRFSILEERMYQIDETFPRIVAETFAGGSMPPGVTDLTYTVDISGEPPVPLSADKVATVYRQLAGASC